MKLLEACLFIIAERPVLMLETLCARWVQRKDAVNEELLALCAASVKNKCSEYENAGWRIEIDEDGCWLVSSPVDPWCSRASFEAAVFAYADSRYDRHCTISEMVPGAQYVDMSDFI